MRRIFQNFLDGKSPLETEQEFAAEGITTRDGKRWIDSNIKVVLTNVTYTGNLLLQKEYVEYPLTKKRKKNRSELPQFYVEDNHEAIISPEIFAMVQREMTKRGRGKKYHSSVHAFSSKIRYRHCGSWYGSKVWHSNIQYRKTI